MDRPTRLNAIAKLLRQAGDSPVSSLRLAEQFGVTERTITRDVTALQQAGLPIWTSIGPGGGYVLSKAATLASVTFTTDEMLAVAVALATGEGLPFASYSRAALRKVLTTMDAGNRHRFEAAADRVYTRDIVVVPSAHCIKIIEEAVRLGRVVNIDYVDAGGNSTERAIEPMALDLYDDRRLLYAWCRLRDDGRVFRLDRVEVALLTSEDAPARELKEVFSDLPPHVIAEHRRSHL